MKFVNVAERPDGLIESILAVMPVANDQGNFNEDEERKFIEEFMSKTTNNLTIELEDHEELFIVIDTKIGFSISKNLPEQKVFNLGSYLKLLAPAQSAFTYYVVMDRKRTDSVAIKELLSLERAACIRNGKKVCDVFSEAKVTIGK